MTYACAAWKLAADTHRLKMQRLQYMVLRTVGKFPSCIPVSELHMAFQVPHFYDYITKFSRKQAEVKQNHENPNVGDTGTGETRHRKYKWVKLGGGQTYDRSSD
jgi:hypothetical protein